MPFGLRNASNTFQRKMDRVKNKLAFCFAFQDDLEVASRTDKEHRQHLRIIFQRLREHGLVINAEKCIFGVPSIDFLGHRVDAAGVTPLPQYVSAVVDFPQPSTVKELQAFLGMLNFYRTVRQRIRKLLRDEGVVPKDWNQARAAGLIRTPGNKGQKPFEAPRGSPLKEMIRERAEIRKVTS